MMGMDNICEVSLLRIVKRAELELPFGSRAKMAMVVRQASFNGGPAYSQNHPVYRGVLTPSVEVILTIGGKPEWPSLVVQCVNPVSMPIANDADGCTGRRCWKKRMPPGNGVDRGSNFALPCKGADFL
jgi:hypothetical protein